MNWESRIPELETTGRKTSSDCWAAMALIGTALLVPLAMSHHPSGHHGQGTLNQIVHGSMIGFLILAWAGLAWYSLRRGLDSFSIVVAIIFFSVSAMAHVLAATMNGFIVPSLHAAGREPISHDVLILCWQFNQAMARLGLVATGAAYLLWGIDQLRSAGTLWRVSGVTGIATAVVPLVLMAANDYRIDVKTAFIAYLLHSIWLFLAGVLLLAGVPDEPRRKDNP